MGQMHRSTAFKLRRRSALSRLSALVLFIVFPSVFPGCSRNDDDEVCTQAEPDAIAVAPADLGIGDQAITTPGAHRLDTAPSVGRFPAGFSVVRVSAILDNTSGARCLKTAFIPDDQAAFWNQLFDTLPPIRETTILRDLGIHPRGAKWQDFLRESLRLKCNLCLLYARVDDDAGNAELLGVLWDASSGTPIATYRIGLDYDEDTLEACEEHDHRGSPLCQPEVHAQGELRLMVRDTLWDLVGHDQRNPTTQPSPWLSDDPLSPRDDDPFERLERLLRQQRP